MEINDQIQLGFEYLKDFLENGLVEILPWIIVLVGISFLGFLIFKLVGVYLQFFGQQSYTIFEIQPLRTTEKKPYTTEQLFNIIHSLVSQQTGWQRFFRVNKTYSFEIVSTKKDGIRYLVRVDKDDADIIKKGLLSYLPGINIKEADDYVKTGGKITDFKLSSLFVFPLRQQQALEKHDPIAYLTGSMTKLAENEMMAFQMVVSAVDKSKQPLVGRASALIATGADLLAGIKKQRKGWGVIKSVVLLIIQIGLLPIGLVVFILTDGREGPVLKLFSGFKTRKSGDPYQQELKALIKNKLDQPLFLTSLRLLVKASDVGKKQNGFASALSSFTNSDYQSIVREKSHRWKVIKKFENFLFANRLQKLFNQTTLSVAEISSLYHFPFARTTKTEDLVKQHSQELPAPLALKQSEKLDVVFANNTYGGETTKIGLSLEERRRHMYILGATGTGKTTMLLSMIDQDLRNGKGLAVIDPHGDLIEDVLSLIPEKRINDVVYFNPDDIAYPMGINLLEFTKGLSDEDTLREKEFVTESIISLFHKIYAERYSGPRMEYILRNTIYTAYTVPGATLFTIYKLLINTPFRKSVVNKLEEGDLKDFWRYEFAKAGDYQKVSMIGPITNKIGRFLFSPSAKRIMEQEKSTIDFTDIMDNKKILLCNLSKGKIGEDTSEVLGVVIMAKLQLAALKRARINMTDRKDFYLYVDEFQNFATPSFAQILSEARKYRLSAILAHQTTSQLQDKSLVNVTLANTGTVVCFRTANPEDERMILPQFRPYIEKGEIASLPSFRFYMKLGAINPQEPFSGITTPVTIKQRRNYLNQIIKASRQNYAIKYKEKKEVGENNTSVVLRPNLLP